MDNEQLLVTYAETERRGALDELVRRNQNLLHHILKRFAYASEPYEDLLQVANLGLIKAAQRFDPQRGVRFSTYATAIVDGELRHHLRDSLLLRQPRWVKKVYQEIQNKSNELMHKLGRPPELAELSEALNINEAGILEVMNLYARIDLHSHNEPFTPGELSRRGRPSAPAPPAPGDLRAAHRGPHRPVRRARQALVVPAPHHLPPLLQGPHADRGRGGAGHDAEEGVARVHQGAGAPQAGAGIPDPLMGSSPSAGGADCGQA